MNYMERAFLDLLQGQVKTRDGDRVPVIIRQFPTMKLPCITVNQFGSNNSADYRRIIHNPEAGIKLKKSADLSVKIFSNSLKELDYLQRQVETIFYEALTNQYTRCNYYDSDKKECLNLERECEALTVNNRFSLKGQCPNKEANGYCSWFKAHNIIKNSFNIYEPSSVTEYDETPAVYSISSNYNMEFYVVYKHGGAIFKDFKINMNGE